MARVPKQNPDRDERQGRARIILRWKARLPGVDLFVVKKDVKDAFRRVVMREMADPILDYGKRAVPRQFAEVCGGNEQYWTIAMRPMRGLVGYADALMRGKPRRWAGPLPGSTRDDLAWGDFWQATEVARVLAADEGKRQARFTGALGGTLSINERLALPGAQYRIIWATGDATPERIATVDWTKMKCAFHDVADFMGAIRAPMGVEEDEDKIRQRLGEVGR